MEITSSPRISFSTDFLEEDFIYLNPKSGIERNINIECDKATNVNFEFISTESQTDAMLTADELFFEGKLLPISPTQNLEKLQKINLVPKTEDGEEEKRSNKEDIRVSWFVDEDPSPRPPKCTLLWKELLRLKKQRASTLSPSSSTSSSSSSDSNSHSGPKDANKEGKESLWNREKHVKRIKQGLERTRSASIRIRPLAKTSTSSQGKNSALPPLGSIKKGNVEK